MFERRVKIVLLILLGCAIVVFARLIDLQVIHADEYRQHAADALLLQPRTLPFVRGRILDRTGRLLVSDEPTWDVKIDYGVLADDPTYLAARAGQFRESGRYGAGLEGDAVADALRAEIDHTWLELSRFTGRSEADLQQTAFEVCERIDRVRQTVDGTPTTYEFGLNAGFPQNRPESYAQTPETQPANNLLKRGLFVFFGSGRSRPGACALARQILTYTHHAASRRIAFGVPS